jgi:release factor glutamine methyltransferase
MTYGEALAEGRAVLSDHVGASPDARLLLGAASGLDMATLIARDRDAMPAIEQARYDAHLKRRAMGEPVARILGEAEFWGLRLKLNAATLVPRPDTETLVEAVLEATRGLPPNIAIADLGTGSGAIAIALLTELAEARVIATDISEDALRAARENAERHGVADRIRFAKADFVEDIGGPFDIVVSNPPYIRSESISGLPAEVREHDPRAALDGGGDGLDAYRAILSRAGKLLSESGVLALEVGYDQADSVAALCRRSGLLGVEFRRDLAGHGRVVIARETLSGTNSKVAKKALGKVG